MKSPASIWAISPAPDTLTPILPCNSRTTASIGTPSWIRTSCLLIPRREPARAIQSMSEAFSTPNMKRTLRMIGYLDQLAFREIRKEARLPYQLGKGADLHDLPAVQDDNPVRRLNGAEPVRDNDTCQVE